jgi:hypothetical protein
MPSEPWSGSPLNTDWPLSLASRNSRGACFSGRASTMICITASFFGVNASNRSRRFSMVQPLGKATVMPMSAW